MLGYLKALPLLLIIFVSSVSSSAYSSAHYSTSDKIKISSEIVNTARTRLNSVEQMTRAAAVKVVQPGSMSFGSGTYFKIDDYYIVITAAHVVEKYAELEVLGMAGESVVGKVFYADFNSDIAMLRVEEMSSRVPAKLKYRRGKPNLIGSSITYSGYPNNRDLLTLRGSIAGVEISEDSLIAQSYAWMGASGSGVFDRKTGDFIGVLSAIDVGRGFSLQLIESIVWISPSWKIDKSLMAKGLQKLEQREIDASGGQDEKN
jgi:hypothetical protein